MRITNHMLANSAAKSGIPFQRTSLLEIMSKKSSQGLLGNIGKSTGVSATDVLQKNNYAKLENLSENLNKSALKLVDTDKNSAYDKAKESGDTEDILNNIDKMVEAYNATMKQLKATGGTMNEFYRRQLKDIPAGSREALKSIGITQEKDGSLTVDKKVLQNVDADTLKKVLGSENGLASKVSFLGGRIRQNASANVVSASNRYTSTGLPYTESFENNKYNFFG